MIATSRARSGSAASTASHATEAARGGSNPRASGGSADRLTYKTARDFVRPAVNGKAVGQAATDVVGFVARYAQSGSSEATTLVQLMHTLRIATKSDYSNTNSSTSLNVTLCRNKLVQHLKNIFIDVADTDTDIDELTDNILLIFSERASGGSLFSSDEMFTSSFERVLQQLTGKSPDAGMARRVRIQFASGEITNPGVLNCLAGCCTSIANATINLVKIDTTRGKRELVEASCATNFSVMELANVTFACHVDGANFSQAKLTGVKFNKTVNNSNFTSAIVQRVTTFGGTCQNSEFKRADITETRFARVVNVDFGKSVLRSVYFTDNMERIAFIGGTLTGVNFTRAVDSGERKSARTADPITMSNVSFNSANLNQTTFTAATFSDGCTAIDANFSRGTNLQSCTVFGLIATRACCSPGVFTPEQLIQLGLTVNAESSAAASAVTGARVLNGGNGGVESVRVVNAAAAAGVRSGDGTVTVRHSEVSHQSLEAFMQQRVPSIEGILRQVAAFAREHVGSEGAVERQMAAFAREHVGSEGAVVRQVAAAEPRGEAVSSEAAMERLKWAYFNYLGAQLHVIEGLEAQLRVILSTTGSDSGSEAQFCLDKLKQVVVGARHTIVSIRNLNLKDSVYQQTLTHIDEFLENMGTRVALLVENVRKSSHAYAEATREHLAKQMQIKAQQNAIKAEIDAERARHDTGVSDGTVSDVASATERLAAQLAAHWSKLEEITNSIGPFDAKVQESRVALEESVRVLTGTIESFAVTAASFKTNMSSADDYRLLLKSAHFQAIVARAKLNELKLQQYLALPHFMALLPVERFREIESLVLRSLQEIDATLDGLDPESAAAAPMVAELGKLKECFEIALTDAKLAWQQQSGLPATAAAAAASSDGTTDQRRRGYVPRSAAASDGATVRRYDNMSGAAAAVDRSVQTDFALGGIVLESKVSEEIRVEQAVLIAKLQAAMRDDKLVFASMFDMRDGHRRNLMILGFDVRPRITIPATDDEVVNKDTYRALLEGYKGKDMEVFNRLGDRVTFGEILDSLDDVSLLIQMDPADLAKKVNQYKKHLSNSRVLATATNLELLAMDAAAAVRHASALDEMEARLKLQRDAHYEAIVAKQKANARELDVVNEDESDARITNKLDEEYEIQNLLRDFNKGRLDISVRDVLLPVVTEEASDRLTHVRSEEASQRVLLREAAESLAAAMMSKRNRE